VSIIIIDANGKTHPIVDFPQKFEYGASAAVDKMGKMMYMWIYESDAELSAEFAALDLKTKEWKLISPTNGYYFGMQYQN